MIKYKTHKCQIKTLKPNDEQFIITDGIVKAPRAGFEINENCPNQYRQIIVACVDRGWLKPVAYMTEREMMISGLIQE